MLLASQVIRLAFLLEKPLYAQNLRKLLGWFFISCSKGLHLSISLLVPKKLVATALKLHQCENTSLGRLSCYPCYNNSRGKCACSDRVCRTPRGFEIYYSKTVQWDKREYAVTWLQQENLIQQEPPHVKTALWKSRLLTLSDSEQCKIQRKRCKGRLTSSHNRWCAYNSELRWKLKPRSARSESETCNVSTLCGWRNTSNTSIKPKKCLTHRVKKKESSKHLPSRFLSASSPYWFTDDYRDAINWSICSTADGDYIWFVYPL